MKLKYLTPAAISLAPLASFAVFFGTYLIYLNLFGINELPADVSLVAEQLTASVSTDSTDTTQIPYVEDAIYRIIWSIFALTLVCAVIYSATYSIYTIYQGLLSLPDAPRRGLYITIFLIFGITWWLIFDLPMSGGFGTILHQISGGGDLLEEIKGAANPPIDSQLITNITMANVVATIVLVVAACCAMTHKSLSRNRTDQTETFDLFQQNLIVTAILLCTGILHIYSLYKWQTVFIGPDPEARLILSGMTLSVSIFYTVCFAAIYLPTYLVIRRAAFAWAKSSSNAESNEGVLKFMEDEGVSFGLKNILNFVSLIASPLIVGLLTEFAKI